MTDIEQELAGLDAPGVRRGARRGRILVVHSSDEMYGSDRIVLEVVAELVASDSNDVTVWLPTDVEPGPLGPMLRDLGARVERHPLPILRRLKITPGGFLRLARDAVRTLARLSGRRFDLVYLATSACLPVAPLARLTGVRKVVGHLQEPWGPKDRVGLRPLAGACTALVAVSRSVLGASGLAEDPRAVVVHNGVPHRSRELPAAPPEHRRPHYVIASRWNPHKGHGTLLRAWEKAGCPGELVVLGAVPAVGIGVDVKALVAQHVSRPETVVVVGEVADATPYLQAADAVVLPTDTLEGFGLVTVEAFSEGRAVIASRSGGPEEVIDDGVTGWLFDCTDVDALAELFSTLDVATLRAAGQRAQEVYAAEYTPERMRARIAAVVDGELHRVARGTAPLAVAS
ncbi:glycosyl transferase family 1 [Frondihabitans sp. PhB188]|uniref:glycosyltransferase family 4 protein n=1 Tax=Frondihabitans sp. PhB188 TaxID=2485200 RepID=UPI000F487E0B|nr:glycosyltransferase family 4 protein [Frondihabitans sp. PhB188]ROQ40922.1 glycosyl transferase family 1 [Frondihabitans sp. PhB188]